MQRTFLLAAGLAAVLFGCTSDEDFRDNAVAEARAQCEAQGREFVLREEPKVAKGELMQRDVEIDAQCLGPDDPGYTPPKK